MNVSGLSIDRQLKYLNRRMVDIEGLRAGIQLENFEEIAMIGHRLKGNGLTFGFPLITTLGKTIEEAGLVGHKNQIVEAVNQLEDAVKGYLANLES